MGLIIRLLPYALAGAVGLGAYRWTRENVLVTAGVATVAAAGAAYVTYRVMK